MDFRTLPNCGWETNQMSLKKRICPVQGEGYLDYTTFTCPSCRKTLTAHHIRRADEGCQRVRRVRR